MRHSSTYGNPYGRTTRAATQVTLRQLSLHGHPLLPGFYQLAMHRCIVGGPHAPDGRIHRIDAEADDRTRGRRRRSLSATPPSPRPRCTRTGAGRGLQVPDAAYGCPRCSSRGPSHPTGPSTRRASGRTQRSSRAVTRSRRFRTGRARDRRVRGARPATVRAHEPARVPALSVRDRGKAGRCRARRIRGDLSDRTGEPVVGAPGHHRNALGPGACPGL